MRTLTPNDFKRLPEDGAQFETLICQLLEAIGYRILEKPAVGTEGGRDILIERVIKDAMVEQHERVVVQCKHKVHSDRAVNDSDVGVFQNAMTRYQARGYLLVTSTRVTENLAKALREYTKAEVNSLKWANFWDVDEVIKHLNKYPFVQETFFPTQLTSAEALADEVQVWLNAVGYKTVNQQSDAHHVDFIVTVRQGLDIKHLLVRCIDSEITTSRLKTLEDDLDAQKISEAWVISDRRVPSSAQNYTATRTTITPYSLSSFVSNIFASYFDWLCSLVEESDIQHYYVDLACYRPELDRSGKEIGRDHESVIDVYVDNWLVARDANHLSILGEFGSGKTWFCRHYAYRQLKRYLANPVQERLPILINLRDYDGQMEVVSRIGKLLEEQGVQLGGGSEALKELNRRGKLLLIFDGFDEIAVRVDYETLVNHFWNLAEVVVPGSKALLTCRTGYFRYATEAEKVMHGEEPSRRRIVIKPPRFEVLYLESFTENQIREVITHRRGEEAAETILNNPDLKELAQQPVIIEMLVEVLPDLQPDTPINKSEIYRLAVDRWLERDVITRRTFMSKQDKIFFMMELAWEMLSTGKLKIHYRDLPARISQFFGFRPNYDKDHYDYEIRTKSFLQRDHSGNYEFSHKSLVEFLAALRISRNLERAIESKDDIVKLLADQLTICIWIRTDHLEENSENFDQGLGETYEDIKFVWDEWAAPIIQFLWGLGPISRQAIKESLETKEFDDIILGLLTGLGQTKDQQVIPVMLKCYLRFHEVAGSRDNGRHADRYAADLWQIISKELHNLRYEYHYLWEKSPGWVGDPLDWDCAPIGPLLDYEMAQALHDNRIDDAKLLGQFIDMLRSFNSPIINGASFEEGDAFLVEHPDALLRIMHAVTKRKFSQTIKLLNEAYESSHYSNLDEFLALEQKQKLEFLEKIHSVVPLDAILRMLANAYEEVSDEEIRASIESTRQAVARKLYMRFADKQSDR